MIQSVPPALDDAFAQRLQKTAARQQLNGTHGFEPLLPLVAPVVRKHAETHPSMMAPTECRLLFRDGLGRSLPPSYPFHYAFILPMGKG